MKSNTSVLLVDDNRDIRESIADILDSKGYAVTECDSASSALAMFRKDPFPLVVSDIVMDGMTGIELLQQVKQHRPETEVILITGFASVETAVAALRHGAFDYITKTYDNLVLLPDILHRAEEKFRRTEEQRMLLENMQQAHTVLESTRSELQDAAGFDEETGLYSHRRFQELLRGEAHRSARFGKKFSLILLAVDVGREGLFPAVTRTVTQRLRKSDVIARYEEDMIGIMLPETGQAGTDHVIEDLAKLVAELMPSSMNRVRAGVIDAAAVFPDNGVDAAGLIRHALEALNAKRPNAVSHR
jgi:PleD family two-component response regulator